MKGAARPAKQREGATQLQEEECELPLLDMAPIDKREVVNQPVTHLRLKASRRPRPCLVPRPSVCDTDVSLPDLTPDPPPPMVRLNQEACGNRVYGCRLDRLLSMPRG